MLFALIHELGHLVTGLILGLKIEEAVRTTGKCEFTAEL